MNLLTFILITASSVLGSTLLSSWVFSGRRPGKIDDGAIPQSRSLPRPDHQWTQDDVANLRKFIDTPTGAKLFEIARAKALNDGVAHAADVFHTQHSAGITTGQENMLKFLWNLASDALLKQISGESPAKDSTTTEPDLHESGPATRRAY